MAVSRASWTAEPEAEGGALAELTHSEFVGTLARYGSVVSYSEALALGLKMSDYTASLRLDLPVVRESRLKLFADVGMGATRVRSSKLGVYGEAGTDLSRTYLSFRGGLTAEYELPHNFRVFITGRELFYLDSDDRLSIEELGRNARILESGSWTFPLTVGFRVAID